MCLATPGLVLEIEGEDPFFKTARVSFGGVVKTVSLACTPEAKVDDYVLVHVGMAISVIDRHEAEKTLEYMRKIDELEADVGAWRTPRRVASDRQVLPE